MLLPGQKKVKTEVFEGLLVMSIRNVFNRPKVL